MHWLAVAAFGVLTMTASFAADDVMASRYGNTTLALYPDGSVTRLWYNAEHTFRAKHGATEFNGIWKIANGELCLEYRLSKLTPYETECFHANPHAIGDVWLEGPRHITLIAGVVTGDTPEALAALAAASRVGNTIVAKDPDGTETRLYWRPDHTFSATRPGWKTEGTWKFLGSSLFLHYNIPRPNMGSDEEMKNATPRKIGEAWGMADRRVTLVAGEQLQQK
jgi:hypothetical protein